MSGYKYCVAHLYVSLVGADVSYHAYKPDAYGLHLVGDFRDPSVVWYDTEREAMRARTKANDCVVSMHSDHIPKFKASAGRENR